MAEPVAAAAGCRRPVRSAGRAVRRGRGRTGVLGTVIAAAIVAGGAGVATSVATVASAQASGFTDEAVESSEGYYQLSWQADGDVRLLESDAPGFADARTLYTGADTARVVSGKPDGRWYYRLVDARSGAVIGQTLTVTVVHHPLARAIAFFVIGAIVFAATLGLIVVGGRKASA